MKRDATETDLKRLDALRDENIDYSDIPELDADFFREAQVVASGEQQPPSRAGGPTGLKDLRRQTERLTR